ncbi:MAG: hypothetical protein WA814_11155, partial [Candidatus Baltobacteraceae bacterium]
LAARVERALPRRSSPWPMVAAFAAALLLGFLPGVYFWQENRAMHGAILAQDAAMGRLAAPHRTASFVGATQEPMARVMYAPDGSWYVVVVPEAAKTLQVAWMHDGEQTMLGDAVPRGNVAMLYLPKSHRMDRLALMDGGRVVAEATLRYE